MARHEALTGRRKSDGAPPGRYTTFDHRSDPTGRVVVPLEAHIRRAKPRIPATDSRRILQRVYSHRNEPDGQGRADEGLVLWCFQQDLDRRCVIMERRLAGRGLSKSILPSGGGYCYVLPGIDHTAHETLGGGVRQATSGS
ncbi:hypothetical protein Athai_46820 [Actinocatenispora thailandica]|uniref:Dyp-type peroxidase C-terminal domain-containing protein n=1 Tax=Actinocatenispora thailandica TaxID=227318 RepID=A0A7R7DSV5_9ACTN|nr:Dyp-type peroxidase domain-containing protein [Actinocatenispora thailandica]BCJ37179.1 hypothetical protein Athai_46820 [Actinocatenispora thailandica]